MSQLNEVAHKVSMACALPVNRVLTRDSAIDLSACRCTLMPIGIAAIQLNVLHIAY